MRSSRTMLLVALAGGCHLALDFEGLQYTGEGGSSGVAGSGASTAGAGGVTSSGGAGGGGGEGAGGGHAGGGGQPPSDCPNGRVEVPTDVPAGWQGFVAIARGPYAGTLPSCSGVVVLHGDLNAADATCSCACGTPSASACAAKIDRFTDSNCSSAAGGAALNKWCNTTPLFSYGKWSGAPTAGMCGGSVNTNVSAATWGQHVHLCSHTPTNVDAQNCADAPGGGFEARLCIHRTGTHACPASEYPLPLQFYGDVLDTRGCEASCSCSGPDTLCGGTLYVYGNSTCATPPTTPNPGLGACFNFGYNSAWYEPTVGSGSCTPASSPQPTGSAVPNSETTICCAQ